VKRPDALGASPNVGDDPARDLKVGRSVECRQSNRRGLTSLTRHPLSYRGVSTTAPLPIPKELVVFFMGKNLQHHDDGTAFIAWLDGVNAAVGARQLKPPCIGEGARKPVLGRERRRDPILGNLVAREGVCLQAGVPPP